MADGQPAPPETISLGDTIAARSALLDFYGAYSVAFSSQFVASIFGLITACALINAALNFLVDKQLINNFSVIIVIFSLFIFIGFISAALYTYNRLTYYSDLASAIVSFPLGLQEAAKLDKITVKIKVKNNKKSIEALERTFFEIKEKLPDNYKAIIEKCQHLDVNFRTYEKISRRTQYKKTIKKILSNRILFAFVLIFGVVCLFLVTYYPLFVVILRLLP